MGAYPVPYNGGYNNSYSPVGPQAYDPRWPGWHPWGYGPSYPPPGYFPPPIFVPYYPQPGYPGGGGYPGTPGGGGNGQNNLSPEFNALRNITANVRNVGNGDDQLSEEELEELRNQALLRGDTQTANVASELMEHYDDLNDEGGFWIFSHDKGISEDTLFDILAGVSEGQSLDSAIAEEAEDHD